MSILQVDLKFKMRDGYLLSGTLYWPKPCLAIALILPGSGLVDRDGDVSGEYLGQSFNADKPALSLDIAHSLYEQGIASFRYEKRGVNIKEPFYAPLEDLIEDAQEILKSLKKKFKDSKVLIIGFSEGALIGAHLAQFAEVSGLILMSMPSRNILEILNYQYFTWPIQHIKEILDPKGSGYIDPHLLAHSEPKDFPMLSAPEWEELRGSTKPVSVFLDIYPLFLGKYTAVTEYARSSLLFKWYESMKFISPLWRLWPDLIPKPIFIYQAEQDAQLDPRWIREDIYRLEKAGFGNELNLRLFFEMGHCFSPMLGKFNLTKTSGPMSHKVLQQLIDDVKEICSRV